jgi:simple sugar transport system permease protein
MDFNTVLGAIFSAAFVASVLRISAPLILPALGGLLTELAGSINIALEGTMLVGAFTGVVVSAYTQSWVLGFLAGIIAGTLFSLLLAFAHLYLGTNIILAGIALNIMAQGGTIFLLYTLTGDKGNSSTLASLKVPNVIIPGIHNIPVLGEIVSGYPVFVYLAFFLTWLVSIFLYRTRLGTHLRAVGENAEAAASVGINVNRIKVIAIGLSGVLAALGGLNLSMAYLSLFQNSMTANRGFVALAAVYLGGRKPWGTLLAAIIFGFAQALAINLGSLKIPPQLVQMIPYAATIIALVVYNVQQAARARERARRFQEQHMAEVSASQAGSD